MGFPDFPAQGKPIHIRKHYVENGKIQSGLLCAAQSVGCGIKFINGISFVLQVDFHQICNGGFIVYD